MPQEPALHSPMLAPRDLLFSFMKKEGIKVSGLLEQLLWRPRDANSSPA